MPATLFRYKFKAPLIQLVSLISITVIIGTATSAHAIEQGSLEDVNALSQVTNVYPKDFVHGIANFNFSNYHLTPRGIVLQNKGLITQQFIRLDWDFYKPKPAPNQTINEAYFTTALWNDVDTVPAGVVPGRWNEIDFTFGPNVKLFNDWTIESPFTAFKSQTHSYPTCWAWDPRLTYHDHFIRNFSLNPYVEFFDELENKITIVLVPSESHSSFYFALGLDPTYEFQKLPLKLELPTYILIPGNDFYQRTDGSGGGTDLGLVSTMFKVSVPLKFIAFGKWSVYGAVQYFYLNNPGLLDGNQIGGAAQNRQRNFVVFHGGINARF